MTIDDDIPESLEDEMCSELASLNLHFRDRRLRRSMWPCDLCKPSSAGTWPLISMMNSNLDFRFYTKIN